MKSKIILIAILLLSFCRGNLNAQSSTPVLKNVYSGGEDSLRKDISKNIVTSVKGISRDYLLFYQVSLNKKGFKSIIELYGQKDTVALEVINAVQNTSAKWLPSFEEVDKIVIPVFLIVDKESKAINNASYYTITSGDFDIKDKIIRGNLLPPLVINFFHQR